MAEQDHQADGTAPASAAPRPPAPAVPPRRARHALVALGCLAFIAGMVGLTYASVPLYAMFCALTGFGGATRLAGETGAPAKGTGRLITIRFDANVAPGLSWSFAPQQREMTVEVGASSLAFYEARNLTGRETHANATYNVSPPQAGAYFVKMQCFCFEEQTLGPRETLPMPVAFYVDPALLEDPDLRTLGAITLSYTFFPAKPDGRPRAEAPSLQGKPL